MTTSEQAIERALELIYAGASPSEAAVKVLGEAVLTPEAVHEILAVGLAKLAADRLHFSRANSVTPPENVPADGVRSGHFQHRTDHRTEGAGAYFRLRSTFYQGADGTQRPLLKFRRDDWLANAATAAGKVRGWQALQELFDLGVAELNRAGKDVTEELPKAALARLELKADEVLGSRGRAVAG